MKRIVVTGANKGIGKALCEKILSNYSDTYVILGSRDVKRGEDAINDIVQTLGEGVQSRIELLTIDVSDDDSVIAAASSLAAKYGAGEGVVGGGGSDDILYALVNNAAIGFGNSLRDTLNTNFYGPKRVSDAFLPLIDRTVGRVVNLGSGSAPMYITKLDPSKRKLFTDPTATWSDLEDRIKEVAASNEEGVNYYGFSKALLNSYTVQLSQAHPHLCINSCTPGFILTDLTRAFGAVNPPATGTVSPLHCLFSPDIGTGKYFGSDAVRSPLDSYRNPGDPAYEP